MSISSIQYNFSYDKLKFLSARLWPMRTKIHSDGFAPSIKMKYIDVLGTYDACDLISRCNRLEVYD